MQLLLFLETSGSEWEKYFHSLLEDSLSGAEMFFFNMAL